MRRTILLLGLVMAVVAVVLSAPAASTKKHHHKGHSPEGELPNKAGRLKGGLGDGTQ